MIDTTKNVRIQVKISKFSYEFLKRYSKLFNVSISRFCEIAINNRICAVDEIGDYTFEYGFKEKSTLPSFLEDKK